MIAYALVSFFIAVNVMSVVTGVPIGYSETQEK